jgi:hypothetical protein
VLGPGILRLPAGPHTLAPAGKRDTISLADLNATLTAASVDGKRMSFRYRSESRAIARFDRPPIILDIDDAPAPVACLEGTTCTILLPFGEHRVAVQ